MKISLVHWSRGDREFHPGVAALSAMLKKHGHQVAVIVDDDRMTFQTYKEHLESFEPDIFGFTCMSFQWKPVQQRAVWVKELRDIPVVVGGYHPTALPDQVLQHPAVDMICRGEGDHALLELVAKLENGEDYTKVENLWIKQKVDGKEVIHRNNLRPLVQDLDELPWWDRDSFDMDRLLNDVGKLALVWGNEIMPVYAGRGCPYACTFCANSQWLMMYRGKGRFTRKRSVKNIIEELEYLKDRYRIKRFEFWDEMFALGTGWLEDFAELYQERINLPWTAFVRAEICTLPILRKLKAANCQILAMGVEAGNEEYRRRHLKKRTTDKILIEAFDNCREVGIETVASNIIGLPYETPDLVRETIALNRRLDPHALYFFHFAPLPGTELYEVCKKEGYLPNEQEFWYESADNMIYQPTMTEDELNTVWTEFRSLQREIEKKYE
jgi:anaerobic magnesium-protoporphyrin IX monomethyl ester cyclase